MSLRLVTDVVTVVVVSIIIVIGTVAQVLEWIDKFDKYPRVKMFVEAKILRVSLLIVAVLLLGTASTELYKVREALSNPPPRQAPPSPITFPNSVQQTSSGPGSPNVQGGVGDVDIDIDQSNSKPKVNRPHKKR